MNLQRLKNEPVSSTNMEFKMNISKNNTVDVIDSIHDVLTSKIGENTDLSKINQTKQHYLTTDCNFNKYNTSCSISNVSNNQLKDVTYKKDKSYNENIEEVNDNGRVYICK